MANRPAHEIRLGKVKATIWAREVENTTYYNVVFGRLYREGEQWKTTDTFGRDDLPLVSKLADRAHTWIFEQAENA